MAWEKNECRRYATKHEKRIRMRNTHFLESSASYVVKFERHDTLNTVVGLKHSVLIKIFNFVYQILKFRYSMASFVEPLFQPLAMKQKVCLSLTPASP